MTDINLEEGDTVRGSVVVKRYHSGLGVETAVIEPSNRDSENDLIREMKERGWTYHFTRTVTNQMFFREAENWNMEPGAGNS